MSKVYNDITAARKAIYKQIKKVEDGTFSLEKGIVLHKLNTDLMEGYRIQAKAYEIASNSLHTPTTISAVTKELR